MYFAIERKDGGVEIMQCFGDARPETEIARWHSDRQAEVIISSIKPIDPSSIPADRSFRDAWKADLSHDMAKCREITRGRLRRARAPMLAALDVEYQRADESGDAKAKAEIAARKKALRDATADPRIDAAKTVDDLKAVGFPAI